MKTEKMMAADGEFLREYGKQYFIVFRESLDIGRIRVSMIPIGTKGQESMMFYLTVEQMVSLCQDIIRGVFAKKIAEDTGNFPSAYKFVTGKDGSLHMNIGGGQAGVRIQIQDSAKKKTYIMAVNLAAFEALAHKFRIFTGLQPVMDGSYYADIVETFQKGRASRGHYPKNKES